MKKMILLSALLAAGCGVASSNKASNLNVQPAQPARPQTTHYTLRAIENAATTQARLYNTLLSFVALQRIFKYERVRQRGTLLTVEDAQRNKIECAVAAGTEYSCGIDLTSTTLAYSENPETLQAFLYHALKNYKLENPAVPEVTTTGRSIATGATVRLSDSITTILCSARLKEAAPQAPQDPEYQCQFAFDRGKL